MKTIRSPVREGPTGVDDLGDGERDRERHGAADAREAAEDAAAVADPAQALLGPAVEQPDEVGGGEQEGEAHGDEHDGDHRHGQRAGARSEPVSPRAAACASMPTRTNSAPLRTKVDSDQKDWPCCRVSARVRRGPN